MASAADTAAQKASKATEAVKEKTGYAGAQAGDKATETRARAEAGLAGAKQDVRAGVEQAKDETKKAME